MRVAVTGAGGRLGTATMKALRQRWNVDPLFGWDLPEHDLDDPESAVRLVGRDRPQLVVHTAAWTDVDGCARVPDLAMRRNGVATGELAEACASAGAAFIVISTNEVFDGRRTDGVGYSPVDTPNPINAYGASKLAGERAAAEAFGGAGPRLGIVRTSWLFGPGAPDFPAKILAAARAARAEGRPLRAVRDEWACPTYTADLAAAIAVLVETGAFGGVHHVVNTPVASRADWARDVVERARLEVEVTEVDSSEWQRPSTPPRWGVLEPTPLPAGPLRPWRDAMAEYIRRLEERSR